MHSLKQTSDLLVSLGSPVSIEDMTDYILRGLNDGFRAVINGVNARDNSITFDDLLDSQSPLFSNIPLTHLPP